MVDEKRAGVRAVEYAERKDRVLIVEDEENARKGYEQLLQRWGYEVLSVGTAEDAGRRRLGGRRTRARRQGYALFQPYKPSAPPPACAP